MVKIKDKEILIANVDGGFYAIANTCTHKGGSLSEGSLEGNIVTYQIHGSKFDVTTGKCIRKPGNIFKAKIDDATLYELRVDGDDILIFQRGAWDI